MNSKPQVLKFICNMLIIISCTDIIASEHDIIRNLFDNGLETFHLRKKNLTKNEMIEFIEKMPQQHHNKVVIHSHFELAGTYGLKGVHLPREYYRNPFVNGTVSHSFHSENEIKETKTRYDYAFLSPVFNSISKMQYKSIFTLNRLKEFLVNRREKIIALGGVDEGNIEKAIETGFSGIAVLGAVWGSPSPCEKFIKIRKKWETITVRC